ncbi:hypothetical protein DLJ48_00875 [Oenococcus sicerae]|uniref:Uncharacterized protein n=1 Tax=Oenococcus sicerae TaxID=2203724 RepID=A0AAJ1RA38_9LACO|nr:hypothetical protein [Oenococcus sicerae]MDN6900903.1 hypothetical protein [Oenococcus sicerae]QAS69179.1 hypothetical protein DLJ48_00875 [Oenococcus sicerae]
MTIIGIILAIVDLVLGLFLYTHQKKLLLWDEATYPQVKDITLKNGSTLIVLGIIAIIAVIKNSDLFLLICAVLSMIFAWIFLYQLYQLMNSSK